MSTPQIIRGAVCYRGGLNIDADGAPNAYAPPPLVGLDHLANAGYESNWWGLACNTSGVPYVQGPDDPHPGFYVSTTALVDRSHLAQDPRRYVDSTKVPYVSVARDLLTRCGIKMGDLAVVCRAGVAVAAICADVGPAGKYGEGSIALAEALGIPSSPRHGGCSSGVTWLIFPKSAGGWPRDFKAQADALFATWGGLKRLGDVT